MRILNIRLLANILVFIQFGTLGIISLLAVFNFSASYWYVNIGLIAIAIVLLVSAYRSLKPSLRINPIPRAGAEFIQNGIYRRIRHPMYSAVMLFGLGVAGFSSSGSAMVVFGVLVINLVIKARLEDSLLLKAHPEIWAYQVATPGFIPCRCIK